LALTLKELNASVNCRSYYIALAIDRTEGRLIVILLMERYIR